MLNKILLGDVNTMSNNVINMKINLNQGKALTVKSCRSFRYVPLPMCNGNPRRVN